MHEISPQILRLIDAITDARIQANTLDIEIDADRLRYSNWLGALATAGLALVLTNVDKLLSPYLSGRIAQGIGPALSGALFIVSLAVGGYIAWRINNEAIQQRLRLILYLKQKSIALSGIYDLENEPSFPEKLFRGHFLDAPDRKSLILSRERALSIKVIHLLLAVQGSFVLSGFILAAACSIKQL